MQIIKKGLLWSMMLCSGMLCAQERMSLAGTWRFQTDPMGFGKTPGSELYLAKLSETIHLPGTTDEGGKGMPVTARYVDRLTRKFEYCGQAWYQREVDIPADWAGKDIVLTLERCHWETTVYVDGRLVGTDERLSTPNRFSLAPFLTPGIHTITICIDNRLKYPMDQWNHGTTEYTQTNWNGIVGKMELTAYERNRIASLRAYPDIKNASVRLELDIAHGDTVDTAAELLLTIREKGGKSIIEKNIPVTLEGKQKKAHLSQTLALGRDIKLWNEFSPALYEVSARLTVADCSDQHTTTFGMREVTQGKHHIQVNGRNVHLRGALDCCVFPRTGYPATDTAAWATIFRTVKEHGMNHIRFHSWCPPKAAFEAADAVGIYLQAELPMWIKDVGKYPARRDFFEKEMYAILEEYGNHPSFILMCNGNENEGDFSVLEDLVKKARRADTRRLYSASTARTHTASDQYYVSHVTQKGGITVYEGIPSTDWDKTRESDIDVPVIAHESGQRCMYPNFKEMEKYTGVTTPRNFEVFRERLSRNGMLHQADDFFRATGAHTVLQYKEVNESLLRTPNSGGFQLLGLSDFPGQGSAFVGILDAFWESKGLVSPEKFRESCAPTVLLARMPKRAYTTGETFTAKLQIYHYGEHPLRRSRLQWTLQDERGEVFKSGTISTPAISCATVDSLGNISIPLQGITEAKKLTLHATLGKEYHNEWDIWVYPTQTQATPVSNYRYATAYTEEVRRALLEGENVLLIPEKVSGRRTHFAGHFWNPIMFNWNPMIVGTLIHAEHPMFKNFPTSTYADWQWWDILNHATAIPMDGVAPLTPIIQSIDSYENNQKLGIAFEANVGKGKLLVLCVNATKDIANRPATRCLIDAAKTYVSGKDFKPTTTLLPHQVEALLIPKNKEAKRQGENAAIKQLLNQ